MNGEQLGSPAAAILARRASRAALPERLQEQAPYDSSDDEWDPEEDEGEEQEDGDAYEDGTTRGRVTAHYIVPNVTQSSYGLEEEDDRRKSLAEKAWERYRRGGGGAGRLFVSFVRLAQK